MNIIKITDDMLESAYIEESDIDNFKKAKHKDFIKVDGTISQSFIRELSPSGLIYLFNQIREQAWKESHNLTLSNAIARLQNKFESIKTFSTEEGMLVVPGEFLNGFKAAIDELNEVYLKKVD